MATYKVKYGQTIYDIAAQKYGSVDGINKILLDNPSIKLDEKLIVGSEIIINNSSDFIVSQSVVNFFKTKTITNFDQTASGELTTFSDYGILYTEHKNRLSYIDENFWKYNSSISFNNSNLDRCILSSEKKVDNILNTITVEFYLTSVSDGDTIIAHTNGNTRLYVESDNLMISNSSGETIPFLTDEPILVDTLYTVDIWMSGENELSITTNGATRSVDLGILSSDFIFNMIGGTSDTRGMTGDVNYFRDGSSLFSFSEESGNMVISQNYSLYEVLGDNNEALLVDNGGNFLV